MNDKYTHAGHSPVCFTQEDACQKAEIEALRAQVEALTEKAANYEMDLHAAESRVEALAAESEVEEALSAADHMEYGVSTANNCAKNLAAAYRRVVAENERLRQAIENNAKYHAGKPCGDCAENDAEKAAVEAVVEAAKLFRDAWREDHSHIPPLEQTRDMAPYLIRLWGAISDLETLRSKA